jgi:inosine/xanthosine triphosphatase
MKCRIVVASKNPVKIEAVRSGFAQVYPGAELELLSLSVASGVADQPQDDQETLLGAENRVEAARKQCPDADFWTAIEGGIERVEDGMTAFAWVIVRNEQHIGKARTGAFFLPDQIVDLINQGVELGEADDIVFKRSSSKTGNGAIGILTNDIIDRTALYSPAVVMAMVPFINPGLYKR